MAILDHNVEFQSMLFSVRNGGLFLGDKQATIQDLVPTMAKAHNQFRENIMGYNLECPIELEWQKREVEEFVAFISTVRELGLLPEVTTEAIKQACE